MRYILIALRPEQWIKNLFVFLPLIFGKKFFDFPVGLKVVLTFFLFSIAASAVYLVNDIIDLKSDKIHPIKKLRPLPSGKIKISQVKVTAAILGVFAVSFSFLLNKYLGWIITSYLIFNILYTKVLKQVVIIDIFCIGFFFLLRIIAGCTIAEVQISHWIIFCTVLLALFLGLNKRMGELRLLRENAPHHRLVLERYTPYLINQMTSIITGSIAVVYMLYTVDRRTVEEFGTTHLIYTIPFVYYGIFRYLYLIQRYYKDGDPTHILFKDSKLQLNLILWIIVCIAVVYFKI